MCRAQDCRLFACGRSLPDFVHGLEVEVEGLAAGLHAHLLLAGNERRLDASDIVVSRRVPIESALSHLCPKMSHL